MGGSRGRPVPRARSAACAGSCPSQRTYSPPASPLPRRQEEPRGERARPPADSSLPPAAPADVGGGGFPSPRGIPRPARSHRRGRHLPGGGTGLRRRGRGGVGGGALAPAPPAGACGPIGEVSPAPRRRHRRDPSGPRQPEGTGRGADLHICHPRADWPRGRGR